MKPTIRTGYQDGAFFAEVTISDGQRAVFYGESEANALYLARSFVNVPQVETACRGLWAALKNVLCHHRVQEIATDTMEDRRVEARGAMERAAKTLDLDVPVPPSPTIFHQGAHPKALLKPGWYYRPRTPKRTPGGVPLEPTGPFASEADATLAFRRDPEA